MNLSNNFTLEELTFSETAVRKNLDNTPNDEQIANLTELAQSLERIQQLLGSPLRINSAFRSHKVNAAIGGSATSSHMDGYACDFTCPGFGTPLEVCKKLSESDLPYDQLILEYGKWVHVSIDPRMRKENLSKYAGEPYETGFA